MNFKDYHEYQDRIDNLINGYSKVTVGQAIRFLIEELGKSREGMDRFFDDPDQIRQLIEIKEGVVRITAAKFKNQVASLIRGKVKNDLSKYRLIIVFYHLINFYSGKLKISDKEMTDGIQRILEEGIYPPIGDHRKEGDDDSKYRAVDHIFSNPEKASTIHTLRFCIAILGVNLNTFDEVTNSIQLSSEESVLANHEEEKLEKINNDRNANRRKSKLLLFLAIFIFVSALIAGTLVKIFPQASPSPKFIKASDLFQDFHPFEVNQSIDKNFALVLDDALYENIIIMKDTIGSNRLVVPFILTNYSGKTYFADLIYIKHIDTYKLSNPLVEKNGSLGVTSNLIFDIPRKPSQLNRDIHSDEKITSISSNTHYFGRIELMSTDPPKNQAYEFRLGMSLNYRGETFLIESDETIKIGFAD